MTVKTLKELFIHELMDVYDAEEQLLGAIPKMAEAATALELKEALLAHLEVTGRQIERLDRVLETVGVSRERQECSGMRGIVEEGEAASSQVEPGPVLDAAIIASAQKVEHYEICAYGTLRSFARELRLNAAAGLLEETLEEEKLADELLTKLAEKGKINTQANQGGEAAPRGHSPRGKAPR